MKMPSDLAELLAVASRGARVQVARFTGLTAALHFSNEEGLRLAALAPDMAEELIRLREALREVMEDHAWHDELWRFTDETEAVLAALEPRDA